MTIETSILSNPSSGYLLRQYTSSSTLVDTDNPNKGYVKTYTDTSIDCRVSEYINKSKTETVISEAKYLIHILPISTVDNILESNTIIDSDGNELEILSVEKFVVANQTKMYEVYVK